MFVYICTYTLTTLYIYIIVIATIMMLIPDEDLQKSNAKADRAKKLEMEWKLPGESECDMLSIYQSKLYKF